MISIKRRACWPVPAFAVTLLAAALSAGCASPRQEAESLAEAGNPEAALALLKQAHAESSTDTATRAEYLKQREVVVQSWVAKADAARRAGHPEEVRTLLERIDAVSPRDPRADWLRSELARQERHRRLMAEAQSAFDQQQWERAETVARGVLDEDPGDGGARRLLTRVSERLAARSRDARMLVAGRKPVSLEFREATLRSVFEALSQAGGVNFVFDKDVRADAKVSLMLRNTTVDDAMRVILATQQLDRQILNSNSVLVYPANAQQQREHQEMMTRSFYLVNADAKQTQTLVRTMVKTKDLHVDDRLNLLVVRDTPDAMRVVERLVESVDLPEAEVMMDVEVMEISSNLLRQLGLSWPTSVGYGLVPTGDASAAPQYITGGDRSDLHAFISNPLVTARINGTSGSTNLLANPRIRARNHEKAHVQLGNKLPVFTTVTTGASVVNGFIASSVSYIDVGLKLDVEPAVLLDNDIVLKVALEVSSVASQVTGPDGSIAYNVGTRQTSTSIRLKDGETEVLAGLIQDDERKTAAGVPGLSEVPFLGTLFGVRGHTHDKTEIVMLITPHIVRNVSLPPVASAAIFSGTDAQPGAPALRLADDGAQIRMGPQESTPAPVQAAAPAETPAPAAPLSAGEPSLNGPDSIMAGAQFQVSVGNPGGEALNAHLSFDAGVLQSTLPSQVAGQLTVQVPPNGNVPVTFGVKPQVGAGATTIALAGGASLTMRLLPGEPAPAPAPAHP
jgi:general secretion pathway protein D